MVKRWIISLLLCVLLLPCVRGMADPSQEITTKISQQVLDRMETVSNTDVCLSVMVLLDIPDHSGRVTRETAEEIRQEMQEEIDGLLGNDCDYLRLRGWNIQDDSWQRMCERQWAKNEAFGKEVLSSLDIEHSAIIQQSDSLDIPDIWVSVTVEDIYKLASHDAVNKILDYEMVNQRVTTGETTYATYHIGVFTLEDDNQLRYDYTAKDALRMLKKAVGKETSMPQNTPAFVDDPNGDGKVTAQDALQGLQHSVNKRKICFSLQML